ncbi:MAG: hypothetical protein LBC90_08835 [Candidatus Adiutrix sp.]|jgi:hypothetical protein|nr:hypothetical protein [Candidatus Adiutrix sp.]
MEAYQGYTENGKIIPLADQAIPDGRRAIITILDEPMVAQSRLERQKKALLALEQGLADCDEPLPPEFDEILAKRVNLTRKLDL